MIIGAGLLASITGLFTKSNWPPKAELISAGIGGILMGVGARLSFVAILVHFLVALPLEVFTDGFGL
jgi:hypothetical protein